MKRHISAPLDPDVCRTLRAGDSVLLSGVVYTARDVAHKRLCQLAEEGRKLPFSPDNAVIYFVGPSPAAPGRVIGAAGPTTSGRMDAYSPTLMRLGVRGMIGKGKRSRTVINAMKETGSVYFGAVGGAGALLSCCIVSSELICYEDLGAEAVRRLEVKDLPLTVVIDSLGNDIYETGPAAYLDAAARHAL